MYTRGPCRGGDRRGREGRGEKGKGGKGREGEGRGGEALSEVINKKKWCYMCCSGITK